MARSTVSRDPFSDGEFAGRICARNVPVEVVPTPEKILHKNRYFWKQDVLIRKKPCNLAAFFSSRKQERPSGHAEHREWPVLDYGRK